MSNKRASVGKDEVFVQQSPVSSIKQRGNLTGNARVLRDHVGDICDLIHQWNKDLMEGVAVISEIKYIMFDRIDAQKKNSTNFTNSKQLQALSTSLNQICDRMELIVDKLGQKSASILSIQRLGDMRHKITPMFLTWPISKFVDTSQNIYEMFRKEMELKISIKNEICFGADKPTLTFYSTAWFQQPYIEKSVNLNFEAMLKEVGHPSLYDKSSIERIPTKN